MILAAALAWLEREHGAALGTLRKVKRVEVAVDCGGKKFKVTAPDEDKLVEWLIRPLPEPTEDDSEPDDDGQEESE